MIVSPNFLKERANLDELGYPFGSKVDIALTSGAHRSGNNALKQEVDDPSTGPIKGYKPRGTLTSHFYGKWSVFNIKSAGVSMENPGF